MAMTAQSTTRASTADHPAVRGRAPRRPRHLGHRRPRGARHRAPRAPAAGPGVSAGRALITEGLVTFVLTFVVVSVATGERVHEAVKALAVGFALAAAVFIAGPITGAGVNPARALGPMLAAGALHGWWLFLLGPVLGATAAALIYDRFLRRADAPASTPIREDSP